MAGARAGDVDPIDLPNQVGAFLLNHGGVAPGDALYVVFIGGNDVRDARDTLDKQEARGVIRDAVGGIDQALRTLAASGAQAFFVVNVADLGSIPETRLIGEMLGDRGIASRATKLSKRFNRKLKRALKRIEHDLDLEIETFDLFGFFRSVIADAGGLGFTNTRDACFSSVTFTFHPDCNFGLSFDEFVFFDEIHPTAKAHALTGEELLEEVPELDDD